MSNLNAFYHGNSYTVHSACEHCQAMFEHERWCVTKDPNIYYAYMIVTDPSKITLGDSLILHSLGVAWPESVHDLSLVSGITGR